MNGNKAQNELNALLILDKCYWQLSQFFRVSFYLSRFYLLKNLLSFVKYSKPTRISEATPYLKLVLEQYDKVHQGSEGDVTPLLYLGVSLHKAEGKEAEALKAFEDGFKYNGLRPGQTGPNTELWAKASMSRLLRRMGKVSEAEEKEAEIR
jgi:hypothetical protein